MSVRRPRLLPLLGAFAVAYPILEIMTLIWVGHHIGPLATLLILVVGVLVGLVLMRYGRKSWGTILGASLLILPGLLSDVLAVLVFLPVVQRRIEARVLRALPDFAWIRAARTRANQGRSTPPDPEEPNVVKGDVV